MELVELVKRCEGLRLKAYLCPAGIPTIGYGATGADIKLGMVWTIGQAESRLQSDLERFRRGTLQLVPNLKGYKLDAIVDFTFNLGIGRLKASTLRRKLLEEDWEAAQNELRKWVWGGGKKLPGLIARRELEILMMNQADEGA